MESSIRRFVARFQKKGAELSQSMQHNMQTIW